MPTDALNRLEFVALLVCVLVLLACVLSLLAWFAEKWLFPMFDDPAPDVPTPDVPPKAEHSKSFVDSPEDFDLYGSVGLLLKAAFFVLPVIFLGAVLLVAFIFFDVIPLRQSPSHSLDTTAGRMEFVALLALVLVLSVWLILWIIKLVRKVTH